MLNFKVIFRSSEACSSFTKSIFFLFLRRFWVELEVAVFLTVLHVSYCY